MPTQKIRDEFNIRGIIPLFPLQIIEGLSIRFSFQSVKVPRNANYVICGMGGSSQIDDFLRDYLTSVGETIPIFTSRDYALPREANSRSLVTVISYSGNTEEALSCYKEARNKKHRLIVMANGGKLAAAAKRDGVPFVKIPDMPQPRYSLSFQFAYHIKIMQRSGLIKNHTADITRACKQAAKLNYEAKGLAIAKKLNRKYPLLYSDSSYASVLRISAIKIYENSKALAHWNVFPELNHNEMNGFVNSARQGKFVAVMLDAPDIHKRTQKRIDIMTRLVKKQGAEVVRFKLEGSSHLARMISGLTLFDWISFYLAQNNGVDPAPVAMVEEFKKLLG